MIVRTCMLTANHAEAAVDRLARAAIAGVFAVGLFVFAASSEGVPPIVSQAFSGPGEPVQAF